MNILLIGNGFDLAHKLSTRYKDFLVFCNEVSKIFTTTDINGVELIEYFKELEMNQDIKNMLIAAWTNRTYDDTFTTKDPALNELFTLIKENSWVNYFLNCPSYVGENWIDFESEISRVVQVLDEARTKKEQGHPVLKGKNNYNNHILYTFLTEPNKSLRDSLPDVKAVDEQISLLSDDLKKLIRGLEIYLTEFVGKIKSNVMVPEIEKLDIDCVLSFNYTDTFKKKYGADKEINYNYVHGEAKLSNTIESNNMVLGIDEYLPEDRKDKEFAFLSFKKFYQRLLKATDNNYLDWIDEIKDEYEKYVKVQSDAREALLAELTNASQIPLPIQQRTYKEKTKIEYPKHTFYIFGHSLDVTDKDILKLFICNDNVQTKIFYYRRDEEDKSVLGKLITNLIGIIGQEELIRRTGGSHKTIEFIPQSIAKE